MTQEKDDFYEENRQRFSDALNREGITHTTGGEPEIHIRHMIEGYEFDMELYMQSSECIHTQVTEERITQAVDHIKEIVDQILLLVDAEINFKSIEAYWGGAHTTEIPHDRKPSKDDEEYLNWYLDDCLDVAKGIFWESEEGKLMECKITLFDDKRDDGDVYSHYTRLSLKNQQLNREKRALIEEVVSKISNIYEALKGDSFCYANDIDVFRFGPARKARRKLESELYTLRKNSRAKLQELREQIEALTIEMLKDDGGKNSDLYWLIREIVEIAVERLKHGGDDIIEIPYSPDGIETHIKGISVRKLISVFGIIDMELVKEVGNRERKRKKLEEAIENYHEAEKLEF